VRDDLAGPLLGDDREGRIPVGRLPGAIDDSALVGRSERRIVKRPDRLGVLVPLGSNGDRRGYGAGTPERRASGRGRCSSTAEM
jgi:hypothetical protein